MIAEQLDDAEYAALTEKVARERAFGCASYKEKCLRRRIAVRMRARGVHSYAAYAALIDRDDDEYDRLIDALTINVTKLFRNWSTFDAIARLVLPTLWASSAPTLRAWSAGCSSGEEAYSLAALLHRFAVERNIVDQLARVRVLGSDIDRESLAAAARGEFVEAAFADTPADLRRRYFSATPPYTVHRDVRDLVTFERRDLLGERPPAGPLHLITCRNVLIYFDRVSQELLFSRFRDALAPGGFLVLGKVETLLGPVRSQFVAVDARERIFQRR